MNARLLALFLAATFALPAAAQVAMPTPSAEHEQLAQEAGVWDAETKLWMTADAEPMTSKGVETCTMLGKFWLLTEFVGDMMGETFTGRGQISYDPVKKQYVGTWIDSMTPHLCTMTGSYDAAAHTLTMDMEGIDGMTGEPHKWKTITHYPDADSKTFTMQSPVAGKPGEWWTMMEIKYKRREK